METTIQDALLKFKPAIAASYVAIVTRSFNLIQERLGPTFKNVYNDWSFAKIYRETVAPNCTVDHSTKIVSLNAAKLERNSIAYAEFTIAAWQNKIEFKMGDLESAEVKALDGYSFRIFGTRNGDKVAIDQTMIVNVSPKGKVFNQFPARIYVNGKFTPESKYKSSLTKSKV